MPVTHHKPLKPDSDTSRVLDLLRVLVACGSLNGSSDAWVDHPYHRLRVMWHSRVAELRRRGFVIECRRVTDMVGAADYQYRLVSEPEVKP